MAGPLIVIGHRNPDTDSISAAVGYAQLMRLTTDRVVSPARAGEIRPETAYLLDRFGVEIPELVTDIRLRVGDVMTSPAKTVNEQDSLYEVGHQQQELGMRPLPVVDDNGRLRGLTEARDFANIFFQGLDPELADHIPISIENVVRSLDATVLVAAPERRVRDKVTVAAWSDESTRSRLEPDVVLVVGDRTKVQMEAIEFGVGALVVTGGNSVRPEVVEFAHQRGVTLMAVEHHTAGTLRLINMSVPVKYIMRQEPPYCHADDLIDDIRDQLMAERALAVVDDGQRVIGVVTRADILRGGRRQVVLVDHNERGQAIEGIEQAEIIGVIDHHRVADLQTSQPPLMRVEPLGACSTLVAKLYDEAGIEIPPAIAGIMLGAILTDTLLFKSPTTTPEDRRITARLATIAGVDVEELGRQLITIASDVSERSARELVTGDFKSFNLDGDRFGIGVIETGDAAAPLARRSELLQAMRRVRDDGDYASVILVITDVVDDRTTVLVEGHPDAVAQALGGELRNGSLIALPGVYSRKKQIVPALGEIREMISSRG